MEAGDGSRCGRGEKLPEQVELPQPKLSSVQDQPVEPLVNLPEAEPNPWPDGVDGLKTWLTIASMLAYSKEGVTQFAGTRYLALLFGCDRSNVLDRLRLVERVGCGTIVDEGGSG